MRRRGLFAVVAFLAGCDVDKGGLDGFVQSDAAVVDSVAPDTADTFVAVDDTGPMPLDVRELEVALDAPDSGVICDDGGAFCDDKDPCTLNACAEDGSCLFTPYQDLDGDGFQPSGAAPGCPKPFDCDDGNKDAFPGQTTFFAFASDGAEFDYNCDGKAEKRWSKLATCTKSTGGCALTEGWGDAVPACGVEGKWVTACAVNMGDCVATVAVARVQECR